MAALLTDELGRPITAVALGWAGYDAEAVPAISGLLLPWTAVGSLHAVPVLTDAVNMDRRMVLTLLGAAACAPAHEWLLARPETDVARAAGTPLPLGVVDELDGIVGRLRQLDDQVGSGTLLHLIRAHLRHVVELLNERRYSDTVGRRLHATAGELMRLAGWLSFDSGHHPQAQRYWIAGLHAAHAAGDRALGANVVGFMSAQAIDLGQFRESVTLAETARAGYIGGTPRVSAVLDLRTAQAHAYDRSATECRRALDSAFDRLGDAPSSSGEPGWCYWLEESQAHSMAGFCYLRLEDWNRATPPAVRDLGAVETAPHHPHARQVCAPQIGAGEIGAGNPHTAQVGSLQVGAAKVEIGEVLTAEVHSGQVPVCSNAESPAHGQGVLLRHR